jgi:hypothetical protein
MPTKKKTAKPLTLAHKRQFLKQLEAAEQGLKTLSASVKTLRKAAKGASYVGAKPAAARKRPRKRG